MGIMDFLFGKPSQGRLEPQVQQARDYFLEQMMRQYQAGPINLPTYMAMDQPQMYSGTNQLLQSLGLGQVSAPSMPTTNIGGMEVYTSQPFQTQMEQSFAERFPGQYDYLRQPFIDPVTGLPRGADPNAPTEPAVDPEQEEKERRRRRRRRSRRNRERIEQNRRNMNPSNRSTGGLVSQLVSQMPNRVNARNLSDGSRITRTSGAVTRSRMPVARGNRTPTDPSGGRGFRSTISRIFGGGR
jgi:hypothetical protein